MIVLPTVEPIQNALGVLRDGGLIGLPTETVYGLAADATQDRAVAQIFDKKKRPSFNPLIIHGQSKEAFAGQVIWTEKADLLAQTFWPGPLTLVLKRSPSASLSLLVSAGLPSLAIRVPSHPIALRVLQAFGGLLAAPSANLSGKVSPTHASHVEEDFPDLLILDGGATSLGLESTIVDLTGPVPLLLRPGGIPQEDIDSMIGPLGTPCSSHIKAPGMMKSHYAPRLPLRLNADKPLKDEAYLAFGPTPYEGPHVLNLSQQEDLTEAAANLFKMLRLLDHPSYQGIAVAPIPLVRLGLAVNDRLYRAAAPRAL